MRQGADNNRDHEGGKGGGRGRQGTRGEPKRARPGLETVSQAGGGWGRKSCPPPPRLRALSAPGPPAPWTRPSSVGAARAAAAPGRHAGCTSSAPGPG